MKRLIGPLLGITVATLFLVETPAPAFDFSAYQPTNLNAIERESRNSREEGILRVMGMKLAFDALVEGPPQRASVSEAEELQGTLAICSIDDFPSSNYTVWVRSGSLRKKLHVQNVLVPHLKKDLGSKKPLTIRVYAVWLTSMLFDGKRGDKIVMNEYEAL